jgi:4-hydroxy-3-polyprenylbenzoate decarboxylase
VAPPADLRAWIALLEREGELVRIGTEVDPDLEITEITDRTVKGGGPALLFENVKGSEHPLLINQFGTERRMCMAFGAPSLDDVASKLSDVLEMQPPAGLVDKVRGLQKLKSIADSRPKTVRRAPSTVHHASGRHHQRPTHRHTQRRHVSDAEARSARDGDALADPQGRPC